MTTESEDRSDERDDREDVDRSDWDYPKHREVPRAVELHRYGWVISLMITLLTFVWFMGGQNVKLDYLTSRVDKLENQIFELRHETRGTELSPQH